MKNFLFLLALITTNIIAAQEVCETPGETLADLNSITKCSIEEVHKTDKKSTRQISVRISAPKKRYLKRRIHDAKLLATSASALNSSGIAKTNHSTNISETEKLNIITNSLSKDELKKALNFESVDKLPSFENCLDAKKGNELTCFNKEMMKHIERNFNYPSEAILNKTEGKVWIRFVINNDGNISNIKTLGPKGGQLLNNEAVRVISKLPRFTPSLKDGKRVPVKYGLPIHFSLGEE